MELENYYKDKKVLITGNTGFKGTWLTIWLLKLGAKVYGYSKDIPTTPSMHQLCQMDSVVETEYGDILEHQKLNDYIKKIEPDIIFHFAGQAITTLAYQQPLSTFQTNIIGTASILDAFKNLQTQCLFIGITSDKSYLNKEWVWGYKETDEIGGRDPYSASKASAEIILQSYFHTYFKHDNLKKIAIARSGNVIGGGDWAKNRIIPDCIQSWQIGQPVILRSPDAIRPWQHVLDTIYGYLLLARKLDEKDNLSGEAFNFGPNPLKNNTVSQIVHQLSQCMQDMGITAKYNIERNSDNFESEILKLNSEKALNLLNWSPILDIDQSIQFTGEWYANYILKSENLLNLTIQQICQFEELIIK